MEEAERKRGDGVLELELRRRRNIFEDCHPQEKKEVPQIVLLSEKKLITFFRKLPAVPQLLPVPAAPDSDEHGVLPSPTTSDEF
jgi:hypothetical protein